MSGYAVAHLVNLCVCDTSVFIDHCDVVRCRFGLLAEQRDDSLRGVVIDIVLVEAVEQFYL